MSPADAAVERLAAALGPFIRRRVPGPAAEDVLQDTLLRVFLGASTLQQPGALLGWAHQVARNAILDHQRRSAVLSRRLVAAEEAPEPVFDEAVETGDALLPLLSACVEPFLTELPAAQAEALRLTDLGGLSQAEAARRLGLPLPTLKARVQRGRQRLRRRYQDCCALVQDRRGAVVEVVPRACACPPAG